MYRKKTRLFLVALAATSLCACIDYTYDLANKEITTNIEMEDNELTLPLGSLEPFMLDSLINMEETSIIKLIDDVYSVCFNDDILSLSKDIEPIKLAIAPIKKSKELNFAKIGTAPALTRGGAAYEQPLLSADIAMDMPFVLNQEIPAEIDRVDSIEFVNDVPIGLTINLSGLDAIDIDLTLDLDIVLPSCLKWYSADETVTKKGDTLNLVVDYNPSANKAINITPFCTGLDFSDVTFTTENEQAGSTNKADRILKYATDLKIEGSIALNVIKIKPELLTNKIAFNAELAVGEITPKAFHGVYAGKLDKIEKGLEFDYSESLAFLNNGNNSLVLSEPQIMVELDNSISIPVIIDLSLVGKDEYGDVIESFNIQIEDVQIMPALYDKTTGEVTPQKTKLLFVNDRSQGDKEGYTTIEIPNLSRLLDKLPTFVEFSLQPTIDTSVSHHVDISKSLSLNASYDVVIPFKFDNLNITYQDTIPNLNASIGAFMEMLSDINFTTRMNVKNTIPVELLLRIAALDENDKQLEGVTIDPIHIAAGNSNSLETAEPTATAISIKSKTGNISALDKLLFEVTATTENVEGAATIKSNQGFQLTDIVIEIGGDIETSFDNSNND